MSFGCFVEFALRSRAFRAASATEPVSGGDACDLAGAAKAAARKITKIENTEADRAALEDLENFGSSLLTYTSCAHVKSVD